MMFPGWYFTNGVPFVSLANATAVATALAVMGILTLALLAVLGATEFVNARDTSGPIRVARRSPRRPIVFRRHACLGVHR